MQHLCIHTDSRKDSLQPTQHISLGLLALPKKPGTPIVLAEHNLNSQPRLMPLDSHKHLRIAMERHSAHQRGFALAVIIPDTTRGIISALRRQTKIKKTISA